jgi:hypothetical protein
MQHLIFIPPCLTAVPKVSICVNYSLVYLMTSWILVFHAYGEVFVLPSAAFFVVSDLGDTKCGVVDSPGKPALPVVYAFRIVLPCTIGIEDTEAAKVLGCTREEPLDEVLQRDEKIVEVNHEERRGGRRESKICRHV